MALRISSFLSHSKLLLLSNGSHVSTENNTDIVSLLRKTIDDHKHATKTRTDNRPQQKWVSSIDQKAGKRKRKAAASTKYSNIPVAESAFSKLPNISDKLTRNLSYRYAELMNIQELVLPLSLVGRSVVVQSETGSGKTLTYAVTAVNKLLKGEISPRNPCLVVAPTNELCNQIHKVFLSLCPKSSSVMLLTHGKSEKVVRQNEQLMDGVPILISTPASLNSKLKQGILRLVDVNMLVVDELDRLLVDDFEDQTKHILSGVSTKSGDVQVMITSATVTEDLVKYMKSCFPDVELVQTGSASPGTLTHQWIVTPLHRRTEVLLHLLEKHTDSEGVCDRGLIFVQRKEIGVGVCTLLEEHGYYVGRLDGDMPGHAREKVFQEFKEGVYDILVTTDLVARGLDIPGCQFVVQVQPGPDIDMYLHRAGRCARAGRAGTSYVIVCEASPGDREVVKAAKEAVPVEIVDASSILPAEERGVTSVLESSLHHVSGRNELSFSIDLPMGERPVTFYQKMVEDLQLKPVNAAQINGKRLFSLWYSSPVEAWSALSVIKTYYKRECLGEAKMGVYRHKSRQRAALDWGAYFAEVRSRKRQDSLDFYANLVKKEMGKKRIRQGRFKRK